MKKSWLIIPTLGLILILGIYYRFDSSFSEKQVIGTYINKNFDNPICCVEAPHVSDTLTLNQDKTFYSNYYGHGTYKLEVGSWTTCIKFNCSDLGVNTYFTKSISGTPRIILNYDMNHFYEKLE